MRKLICATLAAVFLLAAVPLATEKTAQAIDYSTVRVQLSSNNATIFTGLSIAVKGNYFVQENGASFSGGTLTVSYSGGKVVLSHSQTGQLYAGSSVNVMRESFAPSAGTLSMVISGKTRSYLGNFLFKASSNGFRVVNTVPIQHYLYGVVAFEMSDAFPLEALKAQAVAAKCYVLSGMTPSSDYDIGDTASDQVYKGYNASYTAVMNAVDQTYDVWLYLGNSILCSYFAASNGGQTILPSDTWAGTNRYIWDGAYDRREDPYDIANPLTVQEVTFYPTNGDSGKISSALSNYLRNRSTDILRKQYNDPGLVVTFIESIASMQSRSSRTADISLTVTARFSNGEAQSISYAYTEDFAYLTVNGVFTKPQDLRLYVITPMNGGWELRRGRYGHGVGLSQRGAEQMANQGMKYDQILKFYYPGAALRSMGLSMPTDPSNNAAPQGNALGSPIATAVTTGVVNLRAGASTNTTKLDTVPANTSLTIFAQQDGFSLTQYNNKTGYVSNSYLKISQLSTEQPQQSGQTGNAISSFGEVTSSTLNFRDKPVNGKVLQTLKKGAKLDIYGYSDNNKTWYYCTANGKTGYVSAQYVKITGYPTQTPQETAPPANTQQGVVSSGAKGVINSEGAYMRSEPTTSSGRRVASLQIGLEVTILGESGDYYNITVSGHTGYIQKQYVNVASTGSTGTTGGADNSASSVQSGKTSGIVNFRTGPGTKYSKIKQLKKGVALEILGLSDGWYQVRVDGVTGYLSSDYVTVTGAATSTGNTATGTNGVTTGNVNMRSSASTLSSKNVITKLVKGTKLTILSTQNGWHRVSVNGKEGYVSAQYVKAS